MVPIMEINAGDEVNIGGFDYVVENIIPCRKGSYSDAYGIRLVMSSYKHGQLVRKVDSVFLSILSWYFSLKEILLS